MSDSMDESRSPSPSPISSASPETTQHRPRSRSRSRSLPQRSRSGSPEETSNPGNNLYVTGLSTRVTSSDLEKFFGKQGTVLECSLVTDPRTKESRGFAFVTMETREDADRCVKHLNRSVLEGRLVTVEKAKRSRGRTPTPGRYQGRKPSDKRGGGGRRRSRSHSPQRRFDRGPYDRDPYPRDRDSYPRDRDPYPRDRDPYPRDRRGIPQSPYARRADGYPNTYRRRGGYH